MKYTKMNATVKGTTCENEPFEEALEFTMLPPSDSNHYGTGYYMRVKTPYTAQLVDVRYARTTDVEILADQWIDGWYGKNAEEVSKQFVEE